REEDPSTPPDRAPWESGRRTRQLLLECSEARLPRIDFHNEPFRVTAPGRGLGIGRGAAGHAESVVVQRRDAEHRYEGDPLTDQLRKGSASPMRVASTATPRVP